MRCYRSDTRLALVFLFIILVLLMFACKGTVKSPTQPIRSVVWETPRENREAEEAALWLSDSLVAPENLYNAILNDLATIRAKYGEDISEVQITFAPPWVISQIIVGVSDEAKAQIFAGNYHDLDSLNSALRYTGETIRSVGLGNSILLSFKGRLNPERLAELYKKVKSVVWAEPNWFYGDWSNVYPCGSMDGRGYLFREAWGDCPSGCTENCLFYFKVESSVIEYVGGWCTMVGPEPDWFSEVKPCWLRFRASI